MRAIETANDVTTLSEKEKNLLFEFDTARTGLQHGLMSIGSTALVIGTALLGLQMLAHMESPLGLTSLIQWMSYIGIGVGLIGLAVYGSRLYADLRKLREVRQLLTQFGLDASRIRSEDLWEGLFPGRG